ncbi:MAG: 50S ribosomal protein L15 [Deltaproteobacteria bacterium]|nr:50S ribosomal protein L15 [Deltaproteobacteria bacterium]
MAPAKKAASSETRRVDLSSLAPAPGSRHRKKRVGFGEGSGHGKTSTRGTKGYGSRSGRKKKKGFEGGQMPLHRRIPKFGFTSRKKVLGVNVFSVVSIEKIAALKSDGVVTLAQLVESGLVPKRARVKVLGGGELTKKVSIEAHAFSTTAKDAIEKVGGEARVVEYSRAA